MQRTCVLWLSCTVVIYFFSSVSTVYGKICFIYSNTVKPVLSDIKQDIFWLFRQVVAYCCIKVVHELSALCSKKEPNHCL